MVLTYIFGFLCHFLQLLKTKLQIHYQAWFCVVL